MTQQSRIQFQRHRRKVVARLLASVAALLSAGLVLTGCAGVNAGSTSAASFKRTFAEDPAIESMEVLSSNDLPWLGGFSATIAASEGLSETDLHDLVDRLGRYRAQNQGTTNSLSVESEGVKFPVSDRSDKTGEFFEFAMRLREDPEVLTAVLEPNLELTLTATTPMATFALAQNLPGHLPNFGAEYTPILELRSAAGEVTLAGQPGAWIGFAEEVWVGAERFAATKLAATPERLELRVAQEGDVTEATAFAKALLAGSKMRLAVISNLLQLADGASGDSARTLLDSLDDEVRSQVLTSWSNDEVLQVTVRSLADAQPFATVMATSREAAVFSTVAIFVPADGADVLAETRESGILDVFADPQDLSGQVDNGLRLLGTPGVTSVQIARDRIEIGTGLAESDLGRLAPALKAAAEVDEWVCVNTTNNSNICVTAKNQIGMEDISYADHPATGSFIREWNSAPALR